MDRTGVEEIDVVVIHRSGEEKTDWSDGKLKRLDRTTVNKMIG